MTRILLHSDSPRAGTGYGVQTALLATRLAADGHEVAVSCKWGHDIGINIWRTPLGHEVPLYPRSPKGTATSVDVLHGHANHFFQGDPSAGWIITLVDVWGFMNPWLREFQFVAWVPIDHITVPPGVSQFHEFYPDVVTLAMSQHGQASLERAGVQAGYIPLAVDTKVMRPTPFPEVTDGRATARQMVRVPAEAFVVGMVAMNKGNVLDRKGFSEAFHAFSLFLRLHPHAVLLLHTDPGGYDGIDLKALAATCGIPDEAVVYTDAYARDVGGFSPSMMAGLYTAMDVLLAPSHGEGFCVPLIEAQACGTPVIASNATAQTELCGAGWLVDGQPQFDHSQGCDAFVPSIRDLVAKLEEAYNSDLVAMQRQAREFAVQYDIDTVYETFWRPFLASLSREPVADKPLMEDVAVVVPVLSRPQNVKPLVDAFNASNDGTARLYFVCDADDEDEIAEIRKHGLEPLISTRGSTFAQKANSGYEQTAESFIFLCGDDVEPTTGWLEAARNLSDRFDVIGTNDSEEGRIRNPDVAAKRHADHWFTRRAYIDEQGACLEGPGVFCPEAYYHWYTDKEVIALARARGVFSACLESRVIHHQPGYDGREDLRAADPVYMRAVEWAERDETTFRRRVPLIEQQRQGRAA